MLNTVAALDASSLVQASAASPSAAIAFAALTAFGMIAGAWAVRRFESWTLLHTAELIAFAAGLLIAGALLHLVPRSAALIGAPASLAWTLAGFSLLFVVEAHFIPHVHARGDAAIDVQAHNHVHVGPLVVGGLAVHSLADGVSVGAALSAGSLIGSVALVLVVAHKLPVGIAAMSALFHSGVESRRAFLITCVLSSVTPVAVLISYFFLRGVSVEFIGILLAVAGGSFLYVGAADLLPEGQAKGRPVNTLMFFLGIFLMIALRLWVH